ncbi:hypothetical protein AGMMS50284_2040 [Clostridia bacterium]|nr:hypothetical protein AGMMS50284_2040 [Clostridia bacterium]
METVSENDYTSTTLLACVIGEILGLVFIAISTFPESWAITVVDRIYLAISLTILAIAIVLLRDSKNHKHTGYKLLVIFIIFFLLFFPFHFTQNYIYSFYYSSQCKTYDMVNDTYDPDQYKKYAAEKYAIEKAIEYARDWDNNYVKLGKLNFIYGRYSTATINFKDAIEYSKSQKAEYFYYLSLAIYNDKNGNETDLMTACETAIGLEPKNSKYHWVMGTVYYRKEHMEEAKTCFTNAINIDSKIAYYYIWRAYTQYKLGNVDEALADCDEAIKLDKNNTEYKEYKQWCENHSNN